MTIYLKIILKLKVEQYIYCSTSFYLGDSTAFTWDKCLETKEKGMRKDKISIFTRILTQNFKSSSFNWWWG